MSRGRCTPYPSQLDEFLGGSPEPTVFSAATLEDRFDHPPHQPRGTNIGGIHKALKRAFADGKVITFLDAAGKPLRESKVVVPGSKAISRPQMFALPGGQSPDPAYHAVTFEETVRRGVTPDGGDDDTADEGIFGAETDDADPACAEDAELADGGHGESSPSDAADAALGVTVKEVSARMRGYPVEGGAPEWIEDRVLRTWVSLPEVRKQVVGGLDRAAGADKFDLMRAGITRKQRSWRSESAIAGNLAKLCRTSHATWRVVVQSAITHYRSETDGIAIDDLPDLIADPLGYYGESEQPPDAVLLFAMVLDVDEADLIAADCARELAELPAIDKATAQQERIETLEAEAGELRRTAKAIDKVLQAALKRGAALNEENASLREQQERTGTAAKAEQTHAERELLKRAERAEAQAEKLENERIPEFEASLEGLEDVQAHLERAEAALHEQQRLRVQAERDASHHSARVRELTEELGRATDNRNFPIDDAVALLDALARPIGQAARHAAERLATARQQPNDGILLELAAQVARMTGRLDVDPVEWLLADTPDGPEQDTEPAPQLTPEPLAAQTTSTEAEPTPPAAVNGSATSVTPTPAPAEPVPAADSPATSGRRLRKRSRLKVTPIGGGGEVGGSAIIVTNNSGHTVLLDCGQRVRGEYGLDTEPQFHRRLGQDGRLHAILISHSHIDHVGSLPILHREQSESQTEPIPVYLTAPTRRLAQIMLNDSAKIQQSRERTTADIGFLDYGAGSMEAAYRVPDVNRVLDDEFVREVTPGLAVPIPDTSFVARFIPVAHVLGSCAIHLTDTENDQTLLYTGDLGPFDDPQRTLPHYALADMLPAHLVVMESTYGSQQQEFTDGRRPRRALTPREAAVKRLCQAAEHAHENGGCMLLPAFSLGRTQELAMLIEHAKRDGEAPPGEIVVGGMGEKITQVYEEYSKGTNSWARAEDMPRVDELGSRLGKQPDLGFEGVVGEVLETGFSYIIASPAMLASGWSRSFLTNMVDDPRHAVVMSGYVPRHGGHIPRLHMLHQGEMIDLSGDRRRIQCKFEQLKGLSAHAPAVDLRKFALYMARQGENVAFGMVHGDGPAQQALAEDVAALPDVVSAEALQNSQVWQPARP